MTAGPWSADAQHGGPPAALLDRGIEGLIRPGSTIGRFTMDLLGPIPLGMLTVRADVVRPGRSVSLLHASLYDEGAGRHVARAQAWTFPLTTDGPGPEQKPLPHTPADGHLEDPPTSWARGYLESVEWLWVEGAVTRPGPAVVWMRPRVRLVPGEEMTGLQRLLTCIDSASGASAALDPDEWAFMNTELTVHVLRPPTGEWICLQAETILGPGSVGVAVSTAYDERGLVARSAQTLLVVERTR
ncbi:MAG: thioesterase family protein [Actinomycetota bacterium]|nr:thioesterase family protein [Actinomycetota bacterium]